MRIRRSSIFLESVSQFSQIREVSDCPGICDFRSSMAASSHFSQYPVTRDPNATSIHSISRLPRDSSTPRSSKKLASRFNLNDSDRRNVDLGSDLEQVVTVPSSRDLCIHLCIASLCRLKRCYACRAEPHDGDDHPKGQYAGGDRQKSRRPVDAPPQRRSRQGSHA